jgi:cytochrome c biogenesis protein CcmG, thiol:disulfide interchange protein DsbE
MSEAVNHGGADGAVPVVEPKSKLRYLVPLALFIVLAVFLYRGLFLNPREVPSPFIGKPAPQFTLAQLAQPDKPFGPADMQGQVWMLNVWASWCVACLQEHPLLVDLAKKKSVPIVGLNYKDKPDAATGWLAKWGDPYDVSVKDLDGRVGIEYGVYGVPETFIIDKGGVIRYKHIGPISPEAWANKMLPLIEQLRKS